MFHQNLNAKLLVQIYNKGLLPSAAEWFGDEEEDWVLQEDNDPKHTSKIAKAWRADKNIVRLHWPPQSPDLNPIENVWGLVKLRVAQRHPKSMEALKKAIREEWKRLPG